MKFTAAPPDFKSKAPNKLKQEPSISKVFYLKCQRSGNTSERAIFPEVAKKDKGGNHTCHTLPTGAVPVPTKDGKREAAGWEFHLQDWKHNDDLVKDVPSKVERCMKTCFLRCDKGAWMQRCSRKWACHELEWQTRTLCFFRQLLLPMCDPAKSGTDGDPGRAFCTKAEAWSQKDTTGFGLGGLCGHEFKQVEAQKLVHFGAALVKDGVQQGGGDGAMFHSWRKSAAQFVTQDLQAASPAHSNGCKSKEGSSCVPTNRHPSKERMAATLHANMTALLHHH
jgi:hypothetical protein